MKLRIPATVGMAVLFLAACGPGAESPEAGGPPPPLVTATSSESPYAGPTIPPGTYMKTFTKAQVTRMGLEPSQFDGGFSTEGTAVVAYKFGDADWTQFEGPTANTLVSGSSGTHHYDESGNLVLSEACCGDSTITWKLDGTKLTLALSPGETDALPMDHLMRDGVYAKTS